MAEGHSVVCAPRVSPRPDGHEGRSRVRAAVNNADTDSQVCVCVCAADSTSSGRTPEEDWPGPTVDPVLLSEEPPTRLPQAALNHIPPFSLKGAQLRLGEMAVVAETWPPCDVTGFWASPGLSHDCQVTCLSCRSHTESYLFHSFCILLISAYAVTEA